MKGIHADLAIAGGGIAGLWVLRCALAAGYNAVLFEAGTLGGVQTLASQGMIHGGLKYALSGLLNPASEAIAGMPDRWRACLAGDSEPDLRGLEVASSKYYLFADSGTIGGLTTFFASRSLRGRIHKLAAAERPAAFAGFDGAIYALDDFAINTEALIHRLCEGVGNRLYSLRLDASNVRRVSDGFCIRAGDAELHMDRLVNCAGAGGGALAELLAPGQFPMQLRPLHQVLVHTQLPAPLFAHCLTRITRPEPRLTLTTHRSTGAGVTGEVLYVGGQIATDGVTRSTEEQIAFARRELAQCLPWLRFEDARFETLRIDRAEPQQASGLRPDQAFVTESDHFIQAWPTKLTLAPDLADRVLALLPPPVPQSSEVIRLPLPTPALGQSPWGFA
ncbi:MAG: FAD-dependent oxidoreductase [Gammaproteobacteria bacterium]|nr:FAD-dependent oxidoreductase [Gammaproteobacteria bacterium]